jgi:hypothetical protein
MSGRSCRPGGGVCGEGSHVAWGERSALLFYVVPPPIGYRSPHADGSGDDIPAGEHLDDASPREIDPDDTGPRMDAQVGAHAAANAAAAVRERCLSRRRRPLADAPSRRGSQVVLLRQWLSQALQQHSYITVRVPCEDGAVKTLALQVLDLERRILTVSGLPEHEYDDTALGRSHSEAKHPDDLVHLHEFCPAPRPQPSAHGLQNKSRRLSRFFPRTCLMSM